MRPSRSSTRASLRMLTSCSASPNSASARAGSRGAGERPGTLSRKSSVSISPTTRRPRSSSRVARGDRLEPDDAIAGPERATTSISLGRSPDVRRAGARRLCRRGVRAQRETNGISRQLHVARVGSTGGIGRSSARRNGLACDRVGLFQQGKEVPHAAMRLAASHSASRPRTYRRCGRAGRRRRPPPASAMGAAES